MQKCGDLHNDDCLVTLKDEWLCCPMCGRKTAEFSLEGVNFNVDAKHPKTVPLKIRLRGRGSLHGHLEFDAKPILESDSANSVLLESANPGFSLNEAKPVANVMITVPGMDKNKHANVYICTRNGRRDRNVEGVWSINGVLERKQHTLHFLSQQQGHIEADETLLIFRQTTQERTLRLRNTGQERGAVRIPLLPAGYLIKPEAPQFFIEAQGEYALTVTCDPRSSAAPTEELLFDFGSGSCRVVLCREAIHYASSYKPRYIVGLDFGTRNTSAILRDTIVSDPALATSFIPDGSPREPTFMYYSKSESKLLLGERAQKAMMESGETDGFFIDRLKEHLISDDEPFVEKARRLNVSKPERFQVDRLLTQYLKDWKRDIDRIILQRSENAIPDVHYVFSYPVLDKGAKCHKHLERMKAAIREAGFPVDSERDCSFVQEPVSAAVYFLIGKARNAELNKAVQQMLSRASLAAGIPLLVIDSGGGTTDVVFGVVKVSADGVPEFTIEHTLGLDSEARRFGGVNVTDDMYEMLREENIRFVLGKAIGRDVSDSEAKYNLIEPIKIYFNSTSPAPVDAITPQNFPNVLNSGRAIAKKLRDELGGMINKVVNSREKLTFKVPADLSDRVVAPRWQALEQAMRQEIFTEHDPKDVYVILVGGNTHLRAIGERCAEMFSESKIIDLSALLNYNLPEMGHDDKMLAVAGGTVWHYGARINNLTPYFTKFFLKKQYNDAPPEAAPEPLLSVEAGKVTTGTAAEKLLDLRGVTQADIVITAKYEATEGQIQRIPIPSHLYGENTQIFISCTPARILVQGQDKQILGEYQF